MYRTVLLLDGSEAMNSTADLLPNKLLALRPHIASLVETYLSFSPLASMSVVTLRDGVANTLCRMSNSAIEILHVMEQRYFLFGGSGAMSLENGLRVSLTHLLSVKEESAANAAREIADAPARIILVSGSTTIIDPTDVFGVIRGVAKMGIRCDVVSLDGAPHVFSELAAQCSGELLCPRTYGHLAEICSHVARSTTIPRRAPAGPPPKLIEIGFPVRRESVNGVAAHPVCPGCRNELSTVPATCTGCGMFVTGLQMVHTSFASLEGLVPPTKGECRSKSSCDQCGAAVPVGSAAFRCLACHALRCGVCEAFTRDVLKICPRCVGGLAVL